MWTTYAMKTFSIMGYKFKLMARFSSKRLLLKQILANMKSLATPINGSRC